MSKPRLLLGEKLAMDQEPDDSYIPIVHIGSLPTGTTVLNESESWRVNTYDTTITGSSLTLTVPSNTEWEILWAWVEYNSATGTVGNRQLVAQVLDNAGTTVIGTLARASVVQSNGITRKYLFAPGISDLLGFRDTEYLTTPIPVSTFLKAGQKFKIYDNKAIAAATDIMSVRVQYASRGV